MRGIGLRSLHENIDTTSATGRLILHIFAALGQFEVELLRERTQTALAASRARGRIGGRPPALDAMKVTAAKAMLASGTMTATVKKLADRAPRCKAVILPDSIDHDSVVAVHVISQPRQQAGRISIDGLYRAKRIYLERQLLDEGLFRIVQRRNFQMDSHLSIAFCQLSQSLRWSTMFERERINDMQDTQREKFSTRGRCRLRESGALIYSR